jgi:very-short-patch-repair endonuclease
MRANPTPAEARLWYHLRAHRFGNHKFRHQTVLAPYIIDFTSRAAMLAIEVDGDTHAAQPAYDAARTRFLESQGFHVLRFTNAEVMTNIEGVLQTIGNVLKTPSPRQRKGQPHNSLSPLAGRGPGRGHEPPGHRLPKPPLPAPLRSPPSPRERREGKL